MSSETVPESFTPASLPDGVVFGVPVYQRLFEWRRKQVVDLFDDLLESTKRPDRRYYLGILTIFERNGILDLIDGQQRLTALMLMGIAFRESVPETAAGWDRFLAGGRRLYFHARPDDNAFLAARCKGELPPGTYRNGAMEDAIAAVKERIMASFGANCVLDVSAAVRLSAHILGKLTLVCSFLPKGYAQDPARLNRYFEVMNSTGRQLRQHEILLVELVNGHPRSQTLTSVWKRIADTSRRYVRRGDKEMGEYRRCYEELLENPSELFVEAEFEDRNAKATTLADIGVRKKTSKTVARTGSLSMIISFEELLLVALEMTVGCKSRSSHYRPDHLLTIFHEAALRVNGLIDSFFDNLLKCRLLIDYKLVWQETDGNFDYDLLTPDPDRRLEKFQSMVHVSDDGQFYKWLVPYLKWLNDNPQSSPAEELDFLKRRERALHPESPDKADLTYPGVRLHWFWRLDYLIWERRDTLFEKGSDNLKAVSRYVFRSNRSREHLHPQNQALNSVWPRDAVDSFGNLALISDSFNSQQGREHVHVKFSRVEVQIREQSLQSLKLLLMHLMAGKDPDGWTVRAAEIHGREMIEMLKSAYCDDGKD